ncbi:MAG: hypothetical protein ABI091_07050 [Ferruginibacter sp.]
MKKVLFTLLFFMQLVFATKTNAQNVSVNETGSMPDTSAMLDVSSISKGLLIPRMNTAQMTAIILPATSLLLFNTDYNYFVTNMGTPLVPDWKALALFDGTTGWKTTGNSGTSAGTNFLGTYDSVDLVLKTTNREAIRITAANNVGIGTATPTGKFSVQQTTSANSGDEKAFTSVFAYISGSHTGSISGGSSIAASLSSGTVAAASGFTAEADNYGGGTITSGTGVSGSAVNNSATGIYSTAIGVSGTASNALTGALTYGYGGYFQSRNEAGGLMPNSMGIFSMSINAGNSPMSQSIGTQSEARNMGTGSVTVSFGSNSFSSNKSTGSITTSYGAQSFSNNDLGGTVTNGIAAYGVTNNTGTGTITNASGSYYEVKNTGGGTMGSANGVVGDVINSGSSTISGFANGGNFSVIHSASSTLGIARGIYTKIDSTGTGAITAGYGLYIDQIHGASSYGIYQANTLNQNYFAGKIGIGTATPRAKVEVNGDVILTSTTIVASGTINDQPRSGLSNLYFNSGTAKILNGIDTPVDGMVIYITNSGANLTINNNSATAPALHKIITGSGGAVIIAADGGAVLVYTGSAWRIVSLVL